LQAEVVSDPADYPQSVAFLTGPENGFLGRGLCVRSCACPCGLWLAVVGHLAVQGSAVFANEQLPVTGAVADGVGGEFMDGKNDVTSAGLWHTGLGGVGSYGRPQRIQRPAIEILRQDRGGVRLVWRPGSCCGFRGLALGLLRLTMGIIGHGQSPG
jgi:hypothetical protein